MFQLFTNKHTNLLKSIFISMILYALLTMGSGGYLIVFIKLISIVFLMLFLFMNPQGGNNAYRYPNIFVYKLLLLLSVVAIIRGILDFGIGYRQMMTLLGDPKLFLPFLFPFLLGCSALTFNFKLFYKLSTIVTIAFAFLVVFNIRELITTSFAMADYVMLEGHSSEFDTMSISMFFSVASAPLVIFLQRDVVPKRIWNIALVNIIIVFLVAVLNGRRSASFGVSLVLFFAFINDKKHRWLLVIAGAILVYSMYVSGMFDFLIARSGTDNRTDLIDNFKADMNLMSWIFGRGSTGAYYDPGLAFAYIIGLRREIENGFYYLILKGGIIYMVTYVVAFGYAAYQGLFKSNNAFVRSFAIIIFVSLLELIPYGIPAWNFKFLSIWMGVAICLNPRLRKMSNLEVRKFLRLE